MAPVSSILSSAVHLPLNMGAGGGPQEGKVNAKKPHDHCNPLPLTDIGNMI